MTLAERIVAARTAKGWTQNHLARVAEVNQPTLQRIEKPRRANMQPTIGTVGRLARALGMTVDELIDGTDVLTLSDAPVCRRHGSSARAPGSDPERDREP